MGRKRKKTKSFTRESVFGWKWIGVSESVCGGGENNRFGFVFFVFVFDIESGSPARSHSISLSLRLVGVPIGDLLNPI
ncbi:hypothetical protein FCV25MIE_07699 [Fagus crenata]